MSIFVLIVQFFKRVIITNTNLLDHPMWHKKSGFVVQFINWPLTYCLFLLSSGGGDRETLPGVVRKRLQVQRYPQLQRRSVWPLSPADSFPRVWMQRQRERWVHFLYCLFSDFWYKVQSALYHMMLLVYLLDSLIPYFMGAKAGPCKHTKVVEGWSDCPVRNNTE